MSGGGFVKIYETILTSSVWLESDATLRVWITMLTRADANGYVAASLPGILFAVQKKLRELGGVIELEALNDDLVMLFELTKLNEHFAINGRQVQAFPTLSLSR